MKKFLFSIGFFIFLSPGAQAQTVRLQVEPQRVRVGETFLLSVQVQSDSSVSVEEPELPRDLDAFQILERSTSLETRSVFEGGQFKVNRVQNFSYTLQALKVGQYSISPVTVIVSGQPILSNRATVIVEDGPARQTPQQDEEVFDEEMDPFSQMDQIFQGLLRRRFENLERQRPPHQQRRNPRDSRRQGGLISPADLNDVFYIEVDVDKTQVYVGEQVTVSWYLVTRAQVTDIDTLKYPTVAGFWREDIELVTRLNFKPEVINGINYSRALLASFALFPLKEGTAVIDEYTARCRLISSSLYGSSGPQTITKSSQKVPITVYPLPKVGQPSSFSGAVGQFKVSAKVQPGPFKTNIPFTLNFRFDGRGNAKPINIDHIVWPEGLEFYDKKINTKYFPDGRSFKDFEILLVPRKTGDLKIPSYEFSFFNPSTKNYYTEATGEIPISVVPGIASIQSSPAPSAPVQGLQQKLTVPTLPALSMQLSAQPPLFAVYGWTLWGALFALGLFFLSLQARKEFFSDQRAETIKEKLKNRMQKINQTIQSNEAKKAAREMANAVSALLGDLSGEGGGGYEIRYLLDQCPPSFKKSYTENIQKIDIELNALAFSPDDYLSQTERLKKVKDVWDRLQPLLNKMIDDYLSIEEHN